MATIREIAKEAGVSPATVSRMLSGNTPVSRDTQNKINTAIATLERKGGQIGTIYGKHIGIIIPNSSTLNLYEHPALFNTMISFLDYIENYGLLNTTIVYDGAKSFSEKLSKDPLDGYLIMHTSMEQETKITELLNEKKIPHVLLNRNAGNFRTGSVCLDDEMATIQMMRHLFSIGHRRIAYIGGNSNYQNTKRRLQGYRNALTEKDIPFDNKIVFTGEYSENFGEEIGGQIIKLGNIPTAVCCGNDSIAVGCIKAFQKAGLKVPEDISVTGFGDDEIYRHTSPSLTTVVQPNDKIGKIAASALIQLMEMPDIDSSTTYIKTKIVIRESSASPREMH